MTLTRRAFLPWLLTLPLGLLRMDNSESEYEKNGKMYFHRRGKTFVVWPDGDGPMTEIERDRARQMAKEYFNNV